MVSGAAAAAVTGGCRAGGCETVGGQRGAYRGGRGLHEGEAGYGGNSRAATERVPEGVCCNSCKKNFSL